MKIFTVEADHVDDIVTSWKNRKPQIDGLQEIQVLVDDKKHRKEREVIIALYWESLEKCKAWRVHPDHIAGHKNQKPRPEWILNVGKKGFHIQ